MKNNDVKISKFLSLVLRNRAARLYKFDERKYKHLTRQGLMFEI
jgi:RNA:NAD 2'-phosphotransferase (TPT1/KptA family)